jgi:hypothetical protein
MYIPIALQLAKGMTRLPLEIIAVLVLLLAPLVLVLAPAYGALGGALAWLILHSVYLTVGTALTHRHVLRGIGRAWLGLEVGIPLAIAVAAGAMGRAALRQLPAAPLPRLAGALATAAIALVGIVATSRFLRATASHAAHRAIWALRKGSAS